MRRLWALGWSLYRVFLRARIMRGLIELSFGAMRVIWCECFTLFGVVRVYVYVLICCVYIHA